MLLLQKKGKTKNALAQCQVENKPMPINPNPNIPPFVVPNHRKRDKNIWDYNVCDDVCVHELGNVRPCDQMHQTPKREKKKK